MGSGGKHVRVPGRRRPNGDEAPSGRLAVVTVPLGNAIGIAGLAITTSAFRKVLRRKVTTNDQRTWLRRRLIIYNSCWLGAGLLCGTTSAAFHLA